MLDQLRIGDKYSYNDFGASVKERKIDAPEKKSIRETVPFSNKTYDFSKINGELYWKERSIEFVFEMLADSAEELEEKKLAFVDWVMNVFEEDIYDPYLENYHYNGTFSAIDIDDSEIEKSTITVKFLVYPYKIANVSNTYAYSISAGEEINATIANMSSHRITPTITSDVDFTLEVGGVSYATPAGEITDEAIKLPVGALDIKLRNNAGADGAITISFYEEVL